MKRAALRKIWQPRNFLFLMAVIFILLRIPSLVEPAWYGDEGIYAAVAAEMKRGELLYVDIWDHKPPAIFYVYLLTSLAGSAQIFVYKLLNLVLGLFTLFYTYKIAGLLFNRVTEKAAINGATCFVTIFLGSTLLEGNIFNAENIFITITTICVYYCLKWSGVRHKFKLPSVWQTSFLAGSLGLALLFKVHPLFDALFIAYLYLIITLSINLRSQEFTLRQLWRSSKYLAAHGAIFALYFFLPIVLIGSYYYTAGHWDTFIEAVLTYNFSYSEVFRKHSLGYIVFLDDLYTRTAFTILLVAGVSLAYYKKLISYRFFVALLWLLFAFFAVRLSSRPYAHYLLQIVVPTGLLIGFAVKNIIYTPNQTLSLLKFSWVLLLLYLFTNLFTQGDQLYFGYQKPIYYPKGYLYATGLMETEQWHEEFVWSAETIAEIKLWLEPYRGQEIFIYSDEAWLYPEADIKNPTRYTVYFHISKDNAREVIKALEAKQVKLLVLEDKRSITPELDSYIASNFAPVEKYDALADEAKDDPKRGIYTIWLRKSLLTATQT